MMKERLAQDAIVRFTDGRAMRYTNVISAGLRLCRGKSPVAILCHPGGEQTQIAHGVRSVGLASPLERTPWCMP